MEPRDYTKPRRLCDTDGGGISPGMILGLAIVAIGVLFLLDNFGIPVGWVWGYWPVILIAIGLAKLVDSRDTPGRGSGAIILLVGVVLIADKIRLPFLNNVSLWSLWPLAIIAVGAVMLWGALEGKGVIPFSGPANPDRISMFSIFGGSNRRVSGEFKGAELVGIFGGGGLDLRDASMPAEAAVVNVTAVFGGFEIRAPETWSVTVKLAGVFGGSDDKTRQPDSRLVPKPKRLMIQGATVFGGCSIRN
jgi:Domain of unknown function (DUF5668)